MCFATRRLILLLALLLGACAGGNDSAADVTVTEAATPTEEAGDEQVDASDPADATTPAATEDVDDGPTVSSAPLTGTLELVAVEGGCLVLVVGEEQYELLVDPSADLAIDPANGVVADAQGNEVAAAGDEVTVRGTTDPGMATFCQVGTPLFITDIEPG